MSNIKWENIPAELQNFPQWVRWLPIDRDGHLTKVPFTPHGAKASVADADTWRPFVHVKEKTDDRGGIGFVLTDVDPYCLIDLDNCIGKDGTLTQWAQDIVYALDSYTELSPSERGLHIFVKAKKPGPRCRTKCSDGAVEIYDKVRFTTVTGHLFGRGEIEYRQAELDILYADLFPPMDERSQNAEIEIVSPTISDSNVIDLAARAKNSPKFKRLFYDGDCAEHASASEADLALLCILAFYTQDPTQLDRIFLTSRLGQRNKAKRDDYRRRTIARALELTRETYRGELRTEETQPDSKEGDSTQSPNNDRPDDHEIAKRVIAKIGDENLIFHFESFYRWDGSGVWKKLHDREIKKNVVAEVSKASKSRIESISDLMKTLLFRREWATDVHSDVINCLNGELHFVDGSFRLLPHNRESYRLTQIPVLFDPSAKAPRFELFLNEVFQDDADREEKKKTICEALGYTLLTTCRLEKFFMLVGDGSNGKSVLLFIVEKLCGSENIAGVSATELHNRFQKSHLFGKLADIVTEMAEGTELPDAVIKAITSGELITVERKFGHPFDFHPYCTLWFSTNHLPTTRDFSDALFRRAVIIRFNRKFENDTKDTRLKEKLMVELPGILNLAMEGLVRLFESDRFTDPASAQELGREWRADNDHVRQFVEDWCERGPQCEIDSQALFEAYTTWARQAGIQRPLARNAFTKRLKMLGVRLKRGTGGTRRLVGITLADRST